MIIPECRVTLISPQGRRIDCQVDYELAANMALWLTFPKTLGMGTPFLSKDHLAELQRYVSQWPPHLTSLGQAVALMAFASGDEAGRTFNLKTLRLLFRLANLSKQEPRVAVILRGLNKYHVLEGDTRLFSLTDLGWQEARQGFTGLLDERSQFRPRPGRTQGTAL